MIQIVPVPVGKDDFAEVFKNLISYKFENNFVGLLK